MPFSFSNLKSPKNERSLKGTGSSCNNRTFNVDADNDDDDDDDDDDDNAGDDYGSGGCGGVNRELEQRRRRPQGRLQKRNRFNDQSNHSARASAF